MTAYVAFRELAEGKVSLDEQVHVSEKAWKTPGSRMFIEVGTKVRLGDLLKGMIIQSGNDASVAIAEHIAGSEQTFAQLMNTHARRLGMTHTHFVNSTGLPDPEHYTTPKDIAKVAAATIREFPEWYAWYAEKQFTFNNIKQHNRNKLLWRDDSVDGIKTGHTEAAGYCLVASAEREGMRLIAVVMGTDSENTRAEESQALLSYGFRFYETHRPYQAGKALKQVRVWKGDREQLALGLHEDLYLTIPRGAYDRLEARMDLDVPLIAPVQGGQQVGTLRIDLDGNAVASAPLIALDGVEEGGLWAEVKDSVLLWLE
jgi:D-alanyl-D-alanine carboxypeptidase (penicillin-binding protein 5/6)